MPDTKRIRVYYEGDDDRVVLEGLQRMTLLPETWEIANRTKKHPGKDGLVQELVPFVAPVNGVGGRAVVLVDLDDLTPEQLIAWFHKELAKAIQGSDPPMTLTKPPAAAGRVTLFTIQGGGQAGKVVLVAVGLLGDDQLSKEHGIDKFAIDDHVLRLLRDERVYSALSELTEVPYSLAIKKIGEVTDLLRNNGINIRQTKRLLLILRAVTAVRPATATLYERLLKKAQEKLSLDELRAVFHPLVDDLANAAGLLMGTQSP